MTSCKQQTFMVEITRLQREVEGLTKVRDMQEAEIQRLKVVADAAKVTATAILHSVPCNFTKEIRDTYDALRHALDKCGYEAKEG